MHKNLLIVVGITILFLGLAIQPGIAIVQTENIDVEYFDVTTEFIGSGKKYTTQLTKEEIEELDALFDSIDERLNKSASLKESVVIFKEAVHELDNFGLLGDIGTDETEKLVTNYYQNPKLMKTLDKLYNKKWRTVDEGENRFCLIAGKTTALLFTSSISLFFVELIWLILSPLTPLFVILIFPALLLIAISYLIVEPSNYIPFCLMRQVFFPYDAEGKIISYGSYGFKKWEGELEGKLELFQNENIGILGFTGLKIEALTRPNQYFIGFAPWVHIEEVLDKNRSK